MLDNASAAVRATMIDVVSLLILYFYYYYLFLCRFGKMQKYKICTNMKPCSYIKLVLSATFMVFLHAFSGASDAMAQEQKQPDIYQQAEAEADRLQRFLELEDWQVFYVDSTLKHDYPAMMAEYEKLFIRMRKNKRICPQAEETQEEVELPELEKECLEKALASMEEAMYALDENVLTKQIEELEGYCYKGHVMKKVLAPVRRKIEMSDYFSAIELVMNWKKETDDKENS